MTNVSNQPEFPKFGSVLDRKRIFAEYGFDGEMYVCRRGIYRGEYQEVCILHIGTNLYGAGLEVYKIIEYMNGEGFVVDPPQYRGRVFQRDWIRADILLFGCYSKKADDAYKVMLEMERGLHGISREWDVMWYFADGCIYWKELKRMGGSGVCSNNEFSTDGICMMHAHLRRRYNLTFRRGLFVTLERLVGDGIDRLVLANPDYDTFGRKIYRFKKEVEKKWNVMDDRDWDWLRSVRCDDRLSTESP